MKEFPKTRIVTARLTQAEYEDLDAFAADRRISRSTCIAQFITTGLRSEAHTTALQASNAERMKALAGPRA